MNLLENSGGRALRVIAAWPLALIASVRPAHCNINQRPPSLEAWGFRWNPKSLENKLRPLRGYIDFAS
uniref:Uncharacterized protein n=1 Tax=Arundo donax TaxID=35708 RepID=A0A0A9ERP8_ARUDO